MKTLYIVGRIVKQIANDKRSVALILIAPLFIFTLIYFLLGNSDYAPKIGVSGLPTKLVEQIEAQGVTVIPLSEAEGKSQVKDRKIDAFYYADGGKTVLLFETNDAVKTGVVQKDITAAMKAMSPASVMQIDFVYGSSNDSLFDSLGYVMLGIISFFLIFILAGISFVRERTNQTMERLMMTPVRRWQVVLGYTLGFGLFAALQSIVLLCFVKWVLGMVINGSIISAGVVMILLAMSAVCIGAFVSIFSNSEFQIMQFIPIIVIPQIFFSGMISLDTLPYHLGLLSKIMPVYYASDALKTIAVRGGGLLDVLPDLIALLIFVLVFFWFNTLALKKYREI